jgi:hypothetical protein
MIWSAITFLLATAACVGQAARADKRSIQMLNDSGFKVEVYWIHPVTKEASLMSSNGVLAGATFPLQTFVGHEFEMREVPSEKTGACTSPDQTCRNTFFTITENDDQSTCIEYSWIQDHLNARQQSYKCSHSLQLPPSLRISSLSSPTI